MARTKSSSPTPQAGLNPAKDRDYEKRERQYRAEDALRTLARADEICKDKGLMRDVKQTAKEQIKTVARVLGKTTPRGR